LCNGIKGYRCTQKSPENNVIRSKEENRREDLKSENCSESIIYDKALIKKKISKDSGIKVTHCAECKANDHPYDQSEDFKL